MPNYYVGLMSGTSMDGIDAVVVDFPDSLSDKTPRLVCAYSHPWPDDVYQQLMASRDIPDEELHLLHDLDIRLGTIFAEATRALLEKARLGADDIIAIGNHGQTLRHRPDASRPFSLQIGDARTLAQQTCIRVISDFRSADIAAGGQGAPLAPAFHAAVFSSENEARGVLNIGGIANLTVLPADAGGDEHDLHERRPSLAYHLPGCLARRCIERCEVTRCCWWPPSSGARHSSLSARVWNTLAR